MTSGGQKIEKLENYFEQSKGKYLFYKCSSKHMLTLSGILFLWNLVNLWLFRAVEGKDSTLIDAKEKGIYVSEIWTY